jgi:broad specificity phosphatase PhoE
VIPKADLREVSLGQADHDIRLLPPKEQAKIEQHILAEGTWDCFPGSEGSTAARKRVGAVMDELIRENAGKRVAVVVHAAFIQTYISLILGLSRDFVFYPFNASINSIRAKGERRVIWRLNDVGHLAGMPAGFGGIS